MSRVSWKGPSSDKIFLVENFYQTEMFSDEPAIKEEIMYEIFSRNFTISNLFLNKTVSIHTGKSFKKIYIEKEKLGFKFGGFAFTRKFTRVEIIKKTLKSKDKKKAVTLKKHVIKIKNKKKSRIQAREKLKKMRGTKV